MSQREREPSGMDPVEAIKARLAVCELESEEWARVYADAEREMREKLEGYHSHHLEIQRLKQALRILEPSS